MIRGLLLDFYGTVVDEDDEIVAEICAEVAASAAVPVSAAEVGTAWWRAFQEAMTGAPFRRQRDIAVRSLAGVMADELCAAQFAYWRAPPLRPGAGAFLASLDIPTCVLSNIDRSDLDAAVNHHGLLFDAIVTSEDVGAYKPAPELFRHGLAALDLTADDVLHVGDSLTADVGGAQAAGIRVGWVNRRGKALPDGVHPTYVVAELAALAVHLSPQP